MSVEERMCINCAIYGWKELHDKSAIMRCSGCQVFWYCSVLCQKEHWRNIHKTQCKYLAEKEVLASAKHDEANCLVCKEESKADKMSKPSNPVLPCTMSRVNICLMNNIPVPNGTPALPLGEMTGNYHSKQDHTVAIMMRILVKMKMTKHIIWRVEKERVEELYGLLGKFRMLVWFPFVLTRPRPFMRKDENLLESKRQISNVMDKLENRLRGSEDKCGDVFKPWCTFKVLTIFLLESWHSRERFLADCIGVAELPEEVERIRMTHEYHTQVWERVLDMLTVGLVPYTRLVVALCDGNPVQQCLDCGEQVTVVDAAATSSNSLNQHHPTIIFADGFVYSLCGEHTTRVENHSKNNSCHQGRLALVKVYGRNSHEYRGDLCDHCGGFNQEMRGHRCAGCRTKVYCGEECLHKDKVHLKLCKSLNEEKRKKKRGKDRRMEKGREEYEKKLSELDLQLSRL